jgi:hypothetical protein
MTGDERTRRCAQCNLSVHNIASLTRVEAETLLARHFDADGNARVGAGRFCAQLYRRADGTILTADCPVGLAALRAKARRTASRVAAAIGLTSFVAWAAATESASFPFAKSQPLSVIAAWLRDPGPNPATALGAMRGKVAVPGGVMIAPPPPPATTNGGSR